MTYVLSRRENTILWCGGLDRTSSMAVESCGRDGRTTRRSVEIGWGAAGLEELTGTVEVLVVAANHQRPPQLQSALEPLEDLDRRIEVLARHFLVTAFGQSGSEGAPQASKSSRARSRSSPSSLTTNALANSNRLSSLSKISIAASRSLRATSSSQRSPWKAKKPTGLARRKVS